MTESTHFAKQSATKAHQQSKMLGIRSKNTSTLSMQSKKQRQKMLIKIRGVTYPNARAAAEAHDVRVDAIYSALNRGKIDAVGTGKCRKKKITLNGFTFPSISAASVALGFGRTYLGKALVNGSEISQKRVANAIKDYAEKTK